ncbi:cell wall-binding repeat-containing protein [Ornithinimicrobium cryptoxanthini]|uniref:Cell wall-binding repeat-containing protein n=2 Tax=Ornithinimicrobium cryptoxanthini TaxID=2934161 RepID=A0ABY4YJS5_9MICO|nr:cell wall-binding repeat-containing protein [Ornithinimicrobium cryptoxanthini]USQ77051.1 cell wall-binding repeat-containing protein [Ornithinimicrobium cryptoxanthini]
MTTTALAAAVLLGGAFASSGTVGDDAVTPLTNAGGEVKDLTGERERPARMAPQDVVSEDGVTRVFGKNRFATAAAIAEFYGWDFTNTVVVYIATGQEYPDALALGPSTFDLGPLLLVGAGSIPAETRAVLTDLEPCFIDVVGGPNSITDAVFDDLKQYAHPEYCEG